MFDKAEAENTKLLRQIDKREKVVHELKQYIEYLKRHFATSFEPKSIGAVDEPDLFSFTNSQTAFSANLTIPNQIMTNDQLSNNFAQNELTNLQDLVSFNQDFFPTQVDVPLIDSLGLGLIFVYSITASKIKNKNFSNDICLK
jgi:hypothetical protein